MPTSVRAARDSDVWAVNSSPASEARALFNMLGRNGDNIEDVRQLINVTPAEELELRAWSAEHPHLASRIETVLHFRAAVAREFDRLLRAPSCRKVLVRRAVRRFDLPGKSLSAGA